MPRNVRSQMKGRKAQCARKEREIIIALYYRCVCVCKPLCLPFTPFLLLFTFPTPTSIPPPFFARMQGKMVSSFKKKKSR